MSLSLVLVLIGPSPSDAARGNGLLHPQHSTSGTESVTHQPKAKKAVRFEEIMMGELVTQDGVHLATTTFRASDGVMLTAIDGEFDSAQRAQQEFEKETAKAAQLLERGKKKDKKENVIGERARIVADSSSSNKAIMAVLWTNGLWFHEIRSTSVRDILELEKLYSY